MNRLIPFAILTLLGLALFFSRDLAYWVAGYRPFGTLGPQEIDEPAALDERDAPRFLAERNQLEIELPREMAVGEFLRLYQIDFPHIRRQIAEQEAVSPLTDDHLLQKGRLLTLTLTPPEEGGP